ncbi:hypothetical protein [Dokdonella sp.]|uniref:hypothetical protein n=1 Tax=Dokdonella sp. TaxID=2291710 RepID=UPI003784E55A
MAGLFDDIKSTLPSYLSPEDQIELLSELRKIVKGQALSGSAFYGSGEAAAIWQGDVFNAITWVRMRAGVPSLEPQTFMVLSNTCDICTDNDRTRAMQVVLAPVATIAKFRAYLEKSLDIKRVDGIVDGIRSQTNTMMFYLPKGGGGLAEDSVVFLDSLQSIPLETLTADDKKRRQATLSGLGWYLLLVKLAMHFCRAFENERRPSAVSGDARSALPLSRLRRLWNAVARRAWGAAS